MTDDKATQNDHRVTMARQLVGSCRVLIGTFEPVIQGSISITSLPPNVLDDQLDGLIRVAQALQEVLVKSTNAPSQK